MGKVKQLYQDMISEVDFKDWDNKPVLSKQGMKFDGAKPRMDLLDWDALGGLAQVLTFGAQKYDAHNWRNGIAYSRVMAALIRHLAAIQRGEDVDPESGLPHVDHLGCCWMFLSSYMKGNYNEFDDRFKRTNSSLS